MKKGFVFFAVPLFFLLGCDQARQIRAGMRISRSVQFEQDTLLVGTTAGFSAPILLIEGDDLDIDFSNSILRSNLPVNQPNRFQGLAIKVQNSRKVRIRNLAVHGFKVALWVENVDALQLDNCDFSYNFRQNLKEAPTTTLDWDDPRAFLDQGAAIYLKNCTGCTLKDITITNGQNGILVDNCTQNTIYNNAIRFNSGLGIGLFSSDSNRIMHNQLDWNLRYYEQRTPPEEIPATGLFVRDGSSQNKIGYNTITHSGAVYPLPNNLYYHNDLYNTTTALLVEDMQQGTVFNPLPDGRRLAPPPQRNQDGRNYALVDSWGPYDFQYPSIWLRAQEGDQYTFLLLGPIGNWKVVGGEGWTYLNPKTGRLPTTLVARRDSTARSAKLELTFIGEQAVDRFGQFYRRGTEIPFSFETKEAQ